LGSRKSTTSYWLDLKYEKDFIPFFDYIHASSVSGSKRILDGVLDYVNEKIYLNGEDVDSRKDLDCYVKTKILEKINDCLALSPYLVSVIDYPRITVNGKVCDNFSVIMDKITKDEEIMSALSKYHRTPLHGDLTVDNIIVSGEDFILLDPNDENYISDPIVDYGKMYQSLHSGYEFLILLKDSQLKGNEISFEENISSKYTELFRHFEKRLSERLSPERFKLIKFHEAVHYFRMLTYKAKINPETFLVFYAISIRLLNEFYTEFYASSHK
jgi:tRNA A-37 threonylcarbamoyl transferase component Bud32